jgi:predicted phosphodiesterase
MGRKIEEIGKLTLEILGKHPTFPTRTLARMLFATHEDIFSSIEHARGSIRDYRGIRGKKGRKMRRNKDFFISKIMPPESSAREWPPYIVDEYLSNALLIGDLHIPYHIREPIKIAFKAAINRNVDTVIINGDAVDFYQLSSFAKNPSNKHTRDEIESLNQFFDYIEDMLPDATIIYKFANHEMRFDTHLWKNSPELFEIDNMNLAAMISAKDRGIITVNEKRTIRWGRLNILHGDEWGGGASCPVNPARTLFLKSKSLAVCGHHHRSSSHSDSVLHDTPISTWSIGCLCDLHPEYRPVNEWNHGFAFLRKDKKQNFELENYKIINGNVYPA